MGNLTGQSTLHHLQRDSGGAAFLKSAFRPEPLSLGMKHMSCEVVFGSPSANCMGTGVCKISAATSMPAWLTSKRNCQSVSAILMPFEEGKGVSIVIARELMCIKLLRTQFRNEWFILNESCRLPDDITSRLGLSMKTLKPGKYRVQEANGFFRINFS
ncbi:MAG: hypothetical protein JNJ57_04280 [Saprospiraceae bacterium]|nr:hypothetical protein [Saprospiraceae bacterium]